MRLCVSLCIPLGSKEGVEEFDGWARDRLQENGVNFPGGGTVFDYLVSVCPCTSV